MNIIDKDKVIELLEEVVKEKGPEYVYRDHWASCRNFLSGGAVTAKEELVEGDPDTPLCIAGHVYDKLGFRPSNTRNIEFGNVASATLRIEEQYPDGVKFTPSAYRVLSRAQSIQDRGGSWGEALEAAKNV